MAGFSLFESQIYLESGADWFSYPWRPSHVAAPLNPKLPLNPMLIVYEHGRWAEWMCWMKLKILAAPPSCRTSGLGMRHSVSLDLESGEVAERVVELSEKAVEAVKRLCWVLFHWIANLMALFAGGKPAGL